MKHNNSMDNIHQDGDLNFVDFDKSVTTDRDIFIKNNSPTKCMVFADPDMQK